MTVRRLHLDFETESTADLKRTGAWVYSRDPRTQVRVMAYWFSDWAHPGVWKRGDPFPQEVIDHVLDDGEIHGWNVLFEFCVWNNVLTRDHPNVPPLRLEQCVDTMAAAAYWGLPLSLDRAGPALGSPHVKDKAGHGLMLRMSRPRRLCPLTGDPEWWADSDPFKLNQLIDYCWQDVRTEAWISDHVPPLPIVERATWLMDARMNLRGIMIDRPLIQRFLAITDQEVASLSRLMHEKTGGAVKSVTEVAKLTRWVRDQGVTIEGLAKDDIVELLNDPTLPAHVREVVQIRREAAKTSTAKLRAMLDAADTDDRVRGSAVYYGANRTGRWAGRLIQIQNFPRGQKGLDPKTVIDLVNAGVMGEALAFLVGFPVLDCVSAALRGCLVAAPGNELVSCDYSAVEARVIAWLAGQVDILDVFARGDDVYVFTANRIGSKDRQLGKVAVLGLGFGMGHEKFVATAKTYGLTLTLEFAKSVVQAWRGANDKIVSFWYDLERACVAALEHPSLTFRAGVNDCLEIRMAKGKLAGALLIILPSGRHLVYRNARLEWHDGKRSIVYDGINQYTRKWEPLRTYGGKLAENVTQAVARDLMRDALLAAENDNFEPVATVHDEGVIEIQAARAERAYRRMRATMSQAPQWAPGLPLDGAGWHGTRYRKG